MAQGAGGQGQETMADALEARVTRLEAELERLRELVDQLSIWVTGGRATSEQS